MRYSVTCIMALSADLASRTTPFVQNVPGSNISSRAMLDLL